MHPLYRSCRSLISHQAAARTSHENSVVERRARPMPSPAGKCRVRRMPSLGAGTRIQIPGSMGSPVRSRVAKSPPVLQTPAPLAAADPRPRPLVSSLGAVSQGRPTWGQPEAVGNLPFSYTPVATGGSLWPLSELIAECLNGQGSIPLCPAPAIHQMT